MTHDVLASKPAGSSRSGRRPFASARAPAFALALAFAATTPASAQAPAASAAEPAPSVLDRPAEVAPLAARGLLLDVTRAGARLVAVGAQGVVITSDDDGATWSQAAVPVGAMLNAVAFADPREGWAVGHRGVILHSTDAGRTWTRLAAPDAADQSFLDVLALDARRILAVGAYGLFLVSDDGGATWRKRSLLEDDFHLNHIARGPSGTLYLAGESGTLLLSRDDGASWELLDPPYEGSFYGLLELASGRLLAHGLRGRVYVSDDQGASWTKVDLPQEILLPAAVELAPGTVAIAGLGGHLFASRDGGSSFTATKIAALGGTAWALPTRDGRLLCVGENGVHVVPLP